MSNNFAIIQLMQLLMLEFRSTVLLFVCYLFFLSLAPFSFLGFFQIEHFVAFHFHLFTGLLYLSLCTHFLWLLQITTYTLNFSVYLEYFTTLSRMQNSSPTRSLASPLDAVVVYIASSCTTHTIRQYYNFCFQQPRMLKIPKEKRSLFYLPSY